MSFILGSPDPALIFISVAVTLVFVFYQVMIVTTYESWIFNCRRIMLYCNFAVSFFMNNLKFGTYLGFLKFRVSFEKIFF